MLLGLAAASLISTSSSGLIPHVGRAPRNLLVFDVRPIHDFATLCLVTSAQGLYNSDGGHADKVYVVGSPEDDKWKDWLVAGRYVKKTRVIPSVEALIRLVKVRKSVVSSESPYQLNDVATTVAGCERRLLVTDPSLLDRYGLSVGTDLRGMFSSNAEAYRWLWKQYGSQINRRGSVVTVPVVTATHTPFQLRDYEVANRLFTFWVSGSEEAKKPGADTASEEVEVRRDLTDEVNPNTPVFGYPWSGDGYGPQEWGGVTMFSQTGHFLLPTDNFSNLSVWTCFPPSKLKVPSVPPRLPVSSAQSDHSTKHCCIYVSDGDNLCTFRDYFPKMWDGLGDKGFPVGWTMAPLLREAASPMYDYAVRHVPSGDSVGSGVSGVGYMSMEEYGKSLGSRRQETVDGFLRLTSDACGRAGEHWLWVMRYGQPGGEGIKQYASPRPYDVILGGYGVVTEAPSKGFETVGKTPVFHCTFDPGGPKDFEANLSKFLARTDCPKSFSVFIMNWGYGPADLRAAAETLRRHGVGIVAPEVLSKT